MVSFPPAKINLGLQVVSKRPDGYHNLSTCFYPLPLTDVLEVLPSETLSFVQTGLSIPGAEQDNLCLKAFRLLQARYTLSPVKIHLHKIIPMGAGLGGGSADAAHTLRLLNTLFEMNLSTAVLMDFAAQLGSDCAFFIQDKPMLGSGRGEILTPLALRLHGKFIVIVKPLVHVSTASAYAGIKPAQPVQALEDILLTQTPTAWSAMVHNDFEDSVFRQYPVIAEVKTALYAAGATYASMSGSGSAVFGLFEKEVDVANAFPGMMVWSSLLEV